ncbi:MAG TPA: serine hydrolase domain-containing protein [Gemmata sp.]|jgi:N-acyl-D-amino-acid deacylase|nr:serine hydrolase domain-containing protein [Gemmata sp.]
MRSILIAHLMLFATQSDAFAQAPRFPTTGKEAKGLEPLDEGVITIMRRHGIPGAALAIAKDGKLVLAKGYGWSNLETGEHVKPDTLFGVASISKSFTAVAILKLVEEGKLKLDDKPFVMLEHIRPHPGVRPDPRLKNITVQHLLIHAGGWDVKKSGDPVNWTTEMQYRRGDKLPVSAEQLISFTLGVPLDFDPGTDEKYSNFGYIVLGEVIEKASGTTYEKYVHEHVLKPAGIVRGSLHPLNGKYFPNEARRYLAGTENEVPPWRQKYSDAAGGWTMSTIDLVRFLTSLDGTRGKPLLKEKTFEAMLAPPSPPLMPRPDGTWYGLGWDIAVRRDAGFGFAKDGLWIGMRSFMKRSPNGVCWALVFNASMQMDADDNKTITDAIKGVLEKIETLDKLPKINLFEDFK